MFLKHYLIFVILFCGSCPFQESLGCPPCRTYHNGKYKKCTSKNVPDGYPSPLGLRSGLNTDFSNISLAIDIDCKEGGPCKEQTDCGKDGECIFNRFKFKIG